MDFQTICAFAFIALMLIFLYKNKKKIVFQYILGPFLYFAMYRTKVGIKFMDSIAKKYPNLIKKLAYVGIIIGFLGMAFITYTLAANIYNLVTKPAAVSGVGVVLPFQVKGAFYVPFFYWIISIFLLALVHEFSHGIVARAYGLKIKSSGFAFLSILVPILPAAFVEPDEKELRKRPHKEQLSVFAAGPFSNIIFAILVIAFMWLVIVPVSNAVFNNNGVLVTGFTEGNETYPAELAGIEENELITAVDGINIESVENFTYLMEDKTAGENVLITTNSTEYNITLAPNPENETMGYLGIYLMQNTEIRGNIVEKYGRLLPEIFIWFVGLFYWLYVLNLGIGLFNLVPVGPIDGGRMLELATDRFFNKEKGDKIWKGISLVVLGLIILNVFWSLIQGIISFVVGLF
jgi:membrane-associated protease RseP (regulator of RpoE activity)